MVKLDLTNNKIKEALNLLTPLFESDISIDEVILFGSQVRGESNEESDIDLAVIHNSNDLKFWKLTREVYKKFNVDFVYTNYERIKKANRQLDVNYWIREEGVSVWKRQQNI